MTVPMSASASRPMTPAVKERAGVRTAMRCGHPQQIDLFGNEPQDAPTDIPAWRELPGETRAALTSLMVRLILDHAQGSKTGSMEAGHDL
jgi:hypothetical protein